MFILVHDQVQVVHYQVQESKFGSMKALTNGQ